jgi:hypothetical protein
MPMRYCLCKIFDQVYFWNDWCWDTYDDDTNTMSKETIWFTSRAAAIEQLFRLRSAEAYTIVTVCTEHEAKLYVAKNNLNFRP